jgi:amino acid adenylation domain-containing protein
MRFLLVQSAPHVPALGGANKHNRALLEDLAARGHDCAVVALGSPEVLARAGGSPPPVVSFRLAGVSVDAVIDGSRLREHVLRRIRDFAPDRVLVSSEDPAQALLEAALQASPGRVVYLAHTTLGLPCGPQAFLPSEKRTALLSRATAVLAASRYVADYLNRWAGVEAAVLPIHFYPAQSPALGGFDAGAVTLVNPSAVKGISIFLDLARRLPETPFAAVPTWGTTAADRAALKALPNVTLLPPSEDIHEIFARTRILLVPSLWAEAFGGICVEAMLCGIPVLASAVGGLPEAMLGVPDLLPVRPIERYEERLDDRGIPVPEIPPQDGGPWLAALRELLADRVLYERRSRQARAAASAYVEAIDHRQTEKFLVRLPAAVVATAVTAAPAAADGVAGKRTDDELRRRLDRISPGKLELLKLRLKKSTGAAAASASSISIPRQPRGAQKGAGDAFPLSFAQQRLWLLQRIDPESAAYNEFLFARLRGALQPTALAAALDGLVARHELLRTRYVAAEGEPCQIVDPPCRRPLPEVCLQGLPAAAREIEMERVARQVARRPVDLERGPVLSAFLLRLSADEHLLVVVVHHIAADHWAITIALRELSALYTAALSGRPVALPPLPIQYADFAVHERQWLSGPVLSGFLDAWRRQLAGAPPVLDLPSDRPRPALQTFRGARAPLALTPPQTVALKERARQEGATLYMLLLAGLQALFHRLTGREDFVLGTPVAGRNRVETESLIGYFLNVLPLRGRPRAELPFRDLLAQARQTTLDAFSRQELPFEKLVEALAPERSLSFSPLFQTLLNFQNVPVHTRKLADLELEPLPIEIGIAKFDLDLYLEEHDQALVGSTFYSTDLFDAPTVERMLRGLIGVLAHAAARPEDPLAAFPLLTAAEAHQVLVEWNDSGEEPGAADLPALVAAQAAQTPDAVAVAGAGSVGSVGGIAGDAGELTYRDLVARAGRLARHLRRFGVGPEVVVGLAVERSPDLVVALLGILAAGGAYLPLDDSYPRERLAQMLADARPDVLLTTDSRTADRFADLPDLPERAPRVLGLDREWAAIDREPGAGLPDSGATSDNLAYVLFTSGSTGRPKGVQIPRRALVNFLLSMRRAPGCAAGERLLAVTSLAFDIAALEIFLPLLSGGTVDLVSREEAADPQALTVRMARAASSSTATTWTMQSTPATWRMLLAAGWAGDSCLRALCGGEALPPDLAAALAPRVGELWNLYGPTETTVWSSRQRLSPGERVTIGRPLAATSLHVLDAAGAPAPLGVPGDLLIGGLGLARGYLGRPDLTAASFVPAPSGGRLYRTGDLARTLSDGRIEHLGRRDHQVKVRGFRIETAEVELALARHPGVAQAVVAVRHDPSGTAYLAAWLVPSGSVSPAVSAAREFHAFLAETLPEFMIPSVFVPLAELPLTANRKVDRQALPERPRAGGALVFAPPGSALEEAVAALWREVLGAPRIGRHDNFFELGGHSLLATQLVSRLQRSLEVDLPVRALFEAPTVAALAARVDAARATGRKPLPPIPRADRGRPLPLSSGQRRLWFLDQLEPGSAAYNVPVLARLDGALDEAALWRSFGGLVARHEVLRTRFESASGEPLLAIAAIGAWPPCRVELGGLPEGRREGELERLADGEAGRPFDLARGPLYRGVLVGIAPERHALLLVLHHIVCDGWSLGVILDELTALYGASVAGETWALPELAVQYADFAAWQLSPAAQERRTGDLAFWRRQLAGAPALLALTTDRPRTAVQSLRGRQVPVRLSPAVRAGLQAESRRHGVTPFMLLLAAFQVLLGRLSGQPDILVGTPVANRTRPEIEGLIGFFVNNLVLRGDLRDFREAEPFAGFLARVRATALAAYDHQDLPFEELVAELTPERNLGHSPLFQVLLALHDAPLAGRELGGLRLTPVPIANGSAKLDLFLALGAEEDGLAGTLEYATALFDRTTAERFVGYFETLVQAVSEPGQAGEPGVLPVGELPLLTAGERRQLLTPVQAVSPGGSETPFLAGAESLRANEEILAGIWGELLGISRAARIARTDSFFDLGGHSLLATQLVSRVRSCFAVELPLRRVFDVPTLSGLAALVESLRAPRAASEPLCRLPRPERLPLSFAQERLWFLYQMDPQSTAFHIGGAVELKGRLDVAALAASLDSISRRHEVLRTRFDRVDGEPRQVIAPAVSRRLPVVDLRALGEPRRERELFRLAAAEGRRPFDLAQGNLLRVQLLRLGARRHVALLSLHHIVGDGWSMAILERELGDHYAALVAGIGGVEGAEAAPPPAAELPLQYADYALWQRQRLAGEEEERQLAYWRRQLRGPLPVLLLPMRRQRPDAPSLVGTVQSFRLSRQGLAALHELGRREGATLFMTLLAAFQALLHGYTGQEDIVVGTNVANRNRTEVEGLIGCFVNNLALRTDLSGNPSFRALLGRVRSVTLDAYAHQDVAFEKVIAEVEPRRQGGYSPLFQAMLVLENYPAAAQELPGLELVPLELPSHNANFELIVTLAESRDGLSGRLTYDADLFDASTMALMASDFVALLEQVAADPDPTLTLLLLNAEPVESILTGSFNESL